MSTSRVCWVACFALLLGCGGDAIDAKAADDDPGGSGGKPSSSGSGGRKGSGGSGGQAPTGSGGYEAAGGGSGGASPGTGGSGGESAGGGSGGSAGAEPGMGGAAGGGGAPGGGGASGGSGAITFPGMHPACPGCKSIFDGKTVTGWTSYGKTASGIGEVMGNWDIQDNALHSVGTARNVLASNGDYNNFRLIFSIKHSGGGHQPCIVIWGRRPPPNDAMGGIQIQAPHTNMWDYRPGQNKNISGTKVGTVAINDAMWSQCEVLAKGTAGQFRMACCQQDATGDKPCRGVEILRFSVADAGNNGPISLQAHNSGVHDEYKNIYVEENPTVDELLTTK
jgi:hypothetical protein